MQLKEFQKYKNRGAYHWQQVSLNPLKRNPFVHGRYLKVIALAKEHFGPELRGKKILDVGCGDGVLTSMFARLGCQASGIDYSEEAVQFAKQKLSNNSYVNFTQGSAYDLPWPDATFDLVVSSDVIEHLTDVKKFLQEISRVLKPSGGVIISTPIRITELPLDREHVVEWFPSEFITVITEEMPNAEFHVSHPVALMELQQRRHFFKILMSLYSFLNNPFIRPNSKWRFYALQYAVWKR